MQTRCMQGIIALHVTHSLHTRKQSSLKRPVNQQDPPLITPCLRLGVGPAPSQSTRTHSSPIRQLLLVLVIVHLNHCFTTLLVPPTSAELPLKIHSPTVPELEIRPNFKFLSYHEFITGKYVVLTGGKTLQFASGSSSTTRTRISPSSDYMMSREVKKNLVKKSFDRLI